MILRLLGVEALARLLSPFASDGDESWLLYGPTDPLVVAVDEPEAAEEPMRWAAE